MNEAPFVTGSPTSEEAANKIRYKANVLREQVYELLKTEGSHTDEEMQILLKMNPSTQRPRRIELVNEGRVRDSGATRPTKSGRDAVLWEVV